GVVPILQSGTAGFAERAARNHKARRAACRDLSAGCCTVKGGRGILGGVIMEAQGDIALIGLAVMGQNLILNMDDHGFTVIAYNRTVSKVDEFLAKEARGTKVLSAHSIEEMVARLKRPRRVMLMVRAGTPVDEFIERLLP